MAFRDDINSLRAISVLCVMLFHYYPEYFPGGFVGVDVFFVISGFLMTAIIQNKIESNRFMYIEFFMARASRLIPALAVMCMTVVVFSWFFLTPLTSGAVGLDAAASLLFLSNILYWYESGYFSALNSQKWLLHTWSLSVEWQFYLLFPICLMLMKRLSYHWFRVVFILFLFGSFVTGLTLSVKSTDFTYYMLPGRVWEMLLGGVAFLLPIKFGLRMGTIVKLFSVVALFLSLFIYDGSVLWPGYAALLPTVAAFLWIWCRYSFDLIEKNKVVRFIGLRSYSIYLWHWPLLLLSEMLLKDKWHVGAVVCTIVFAHLSYTFLERSR